MTKKISWMFLFDFLYLPFTVCMQIRIFYYINVLKCGLKYISYFITNFKILSFRGATTRGGRPGARPPLAPEKGASPPLQNKKKERMAKISITGISKPIELL